MENPIAGLEKGGRQQGTVVWGLILALLFVRIPCLGGIGFFAQLDWLGPGYQLSTCLLTARLAAYYLR